MQAEHCKCSTAVRPVIEDIELRRFERELLEQLRHGQRIVLHGPRGAGKSTLLDMLHRELLVTGVPCGRSLATSHLDDITQTLAQAYPEVSSDAVKRRTARSRLWTAADRRGGVLLLDHVTMVNNAMVGFLRRLVGGIAGVLLAFDVDSKEERVRLRPRRLGAIPLPMPLPSSAALRGLWRSQCDRNGLPRLERAIEQRLLQAAASRPGWIVRCAELVTRAHYWQGGSLVRVNLLCSDTEIAVRFGQAALQGLERAGRLAALRPQLPRSAGPT
jgi:predicted ATPase